MKNNICRVVCVLERWVYNGYLGVSFLNERKMCYKLVNNSIINQSYQNTIPLIKPISRMYVH